MNCNCPKCGAGEFTSTTYSYNCECGFKISKEIWGVPISEKIAEQICTGEKTEVFTFSKDGKDWKAGLAYKDEKVAYVFPEATVVGKCPKCGQDVIEYDQRYSCKAERNVCGFVIWKTISGAKISPTDAKTLLDKKNISKNFTWKNGKTGDAKLKLKDDFSGVEFVFDK